MLVHCAPDYSLRVCDHNDVVTRPGIKNVGLLPKGRHGDRRQRVQLGHIKKLVRALEIDRACAERYLPAIAEGPKDAPPAPRLRCLTGQAKWHSNDGCHEWPTRAFEEAAAIPPTGFHCADCQGLDEKAAL